MPPRKEGGYPANSTDDRSSVGKEFVQRKRPRREKREREKRKEKERRKEREERKREERKRKKEREREKRRMSSSFQPTPVQLAGSLVRSLVLSLFLSIDG